MQFGWLAGRLAGGLGLVQIVFSADLNTTTTLQPPTSYPPLRLVSRHELQRIVTAQLQFSLLSACISQDLPSSKANLTAHCLKHLHFVLMNKTPQH
jgi:hypothetical protein